MPDSIVSSGSAARVVVLDDDPQVATALVRLARSYGHDARCAASYEELVSAAERREVDVLLTDVRLDGMNGLDVARELRSLDASLPVVLVTGLPSVGDAARALEVGAFRYLTKPVSGDGLHDALAGAVHWRRRERSDRAHDDDRRARGALLRSAIDALYMVYQPIVDARTRRVTGFEALVRSRDARLASPLALLEVAEELDRLHDLGRATRACVAADADQLAGDEMLFVNVHGRDLLDDELYDPAAPLSRHATRVVLELTERESLDRCADVERSIARLRALGYRLAVDDLGAGYAGLSYFARVRPEIVKLDMSLVRGIDASTVNRDVVRSLCALCHQLGGRVVAEGIETVAERDTVLELGADMLQGYLFARPGPPFPTVDWS